MTLDIMSFSLVGYVNSMKDVDVVRPTQYSVQRWLLNNNYFVSVNFSYHEVLSERDLTNLNVFLFCIRYTRYKNFSCI